MLHATKPATLEASREDPSDATCPGYDRHRDPGWLRSSALYWARRLELHPGDDEARKVLRQVRDLAEAAGVEFPAQVPEVPAGRRPRCATCGELSQSDEATGGWWCPECSQVVS